MKTTKTAYKTTKLLRSQQGFESKTRNIFIEVVIKPALNANDDKRLQTFDEIASYPYGVNVGKCWKIATISKHKKINFDDITNENKTEHNYFMYLLPFCQ